MSKSDYVKQPIIIDEMQAIFSQVANSANTAGMHIKDYIKNVNRIPENYPAHIRRAVKIMSGER